MDLLRPIIRHLTHGYFLRRDGLNVAPYRGPLARSQYDPEHRLTSLQFEKIQELVAYCHKHNPYYRDLFKAIGFDPQDLKDSSSLAGLPILTKDGIRGAGAHLFSEGFSPENTRHKRTGGSTGVPLHVYWSHDAASFKMAGRLRHDSWAKLSPGKKLAYVWGDTDKPRPLKARIRNALTERSFSLDTLKFDEEHIETFLGKIRRHRPQILMGHAHSVYQLANYVRDNKIEDVSFEAIVSSSMVLTDLERVTIEAVFQTPVFNRYGCEELSIVASECEVREGLHLFAEGVYVELLEGGDDRPGKLVITDLVNYSMPLIRYEIGDYAVALPGSCACGRTLPRLREVSGRTADFLYTPERMPVFGISILDTFLIHIPGFKQVQIVQDRYDHLNFKVVKGEGFSTDSLDLLGRNVVEVFGEKMNYDVTFVERIELTRRGKFRASICAIDDLKDGIGRRQDAVT